jgi:Mn2+/Fe2+ NRAMP family transporter
MLPLMLFVSQPRWMGALVPPPWLRGAGWAVTALVLMFNAALLWSLI